MEERQPRSSSTLLMVVLAGAAIYFGVTQYFGFGEPESGAESSEQAPSSEEDAENESDGEAAEASDDETSDGEAAEEQAAAIDEAGADQGSESVSPSTPARSPEDRRTATITTDLFVATIDNFGGGVSSFQLLGRERYTEEGEPIDLVTTDREEYQSLRMSLGEDRLPEDLVWEIEQVSETQVRLRAEHEGLRVIRSLSAGSGPLPNLVDGPRRQHRRLRARRSALSLQPPLRHAHAGDRGLVHPDRLPLPLHQQRPVPDRR